MRTEVAVSVVVPVYNAALYLEACLMSLTAQTFQHFEIICVEDGSSDDSLAFLEAYQQKETRLLILQNKEESVGAAKARNLGLEEAKGDYVLFLDADDYFHPNMLALLLAKSEAVESDILLFNAYHFDSETKEMIFHPSSIHLRHIPEKDCFSVLDIPEHIFQITHGAAWNQFYRRSFLMAQGLRFQAVVIDDIFFTYASLAVAEKIAILDEKLLYYRVNNGKSQFNTKDRDPLSLIAVGLHLKEWLSQKNLFSLVEGSYQTLIFSIIYLYFSGFRENQSRIALLHGLKEGGFSALGLGEGQGKVQESDGQWVAQIMNSQPEAYVMAQEKEFETLIVKGKPCGIYGFGFRGESLYHKIKAFGGDCVVIADMAIVAEGERFQGIPLVPPKALDPKEIACIYVTVPQYFEEIKDSLEKIGFSLGQIVLI